MVWDFAKIALFSLILLSAISPPADAQSPKEQAKYNLLPLRTHNINAETRSRLSKVLGEELLALRDIVLRQPVLFSSILQQPSSNNRRMSAQIWSASESSLLYSGDKAVVIEPVWCHMFDRDVFMIQIVDRDLGTLLASKHQVFSTGLKVPYPERIKALSEKLPGSLVTLARNLPPIKLGPKTDALHLQIQNGRLSDWKRKAPPECMTMLVEEQLYEQFELVRESGLLHIQHIRQNLGLLEGLRRPTRIVQLSWPDVLPNSDPTTTELLASLSTVEGPFGQPTPAPKPQLIRVTPGEQQINLTVPTELRAYIKTQQDMLQLADAPKVVYIYGAWAYIDKGRAWGLKMRDRLISQGKDQQIEGHVVRYFGPEAKLKDQQGRLIQEGAIVFIREGQRQVQLGQSFHFDPKTYPAPWR